MTPTWLTAPPALAQQVIPSTLEEAYRENSRPETDGADFREVGYRLPPGNVRAEDMMALVGGKVMIARIFSNRDPEYDELKIIHFGRDGVYTWCSDLEDTGRGTARHEWAAMLWKTRGRTLPLLDPAVGVGGIGLSPLYDADTGEALWFGRYNRRWWSWNPGHLQERLPAATWTLCPDFPSAESLGIGVNRAQTAHTYRALVAQDPGRRIKRPDLVTPDARLTYE
ncbi:hypothetical protein [Tateyamaria sp.]|uniref:hypothetical protein n=1 Tax=Tateyamaria sp. TaxID=1929288 RepID=UPI003B2239FC